MKCKCDMRTKLVGDGCEACNPQLALDMALGAYWDAAVAEGADGRDHDTPDGDAQRALEAVHSAVAAMVAAERAAERERCMGAMDSHGQYWVENRSRIIDAVTAAGFQIVSDRDRFWLQPIRA